MRLEVGATNAARARLVLGETQEPPAVVESARETRRAEEQVRGARSWNFPVLLAFLAGMLLGLGLGAALAR